MRQDQPPSETRRRYRRVTSDEAERMQNLYTQEKLSSVQIGALLDRDPAIVRRTLHARGVATERLKWNAPLALELLAKGVPVDEVSQIVGRSRKLICQYATRHRKC